MKTEYKYIKFENCGSMWICRNRKKDYPLGMVTYIGKWKEWEFCPDSDMGFTIECLNDIAHFIGQLNEQSKAAKTHD